MSRLAGDTTQRMREAFTVEMSAATKQAHEASIGDALNTAGGPPVGVRTSSWRVRVPALAAALLIVLPVGTAFAAEDAVPGDLLYPVKRLVEPIRSVVDSDVVAQHRVDELAYLLEIPDETHRLTDAVSDARDAVSDLPADHYLRTDLEQLTDRVTDAAPADVPSHDEVDSDHPEVDSDHPESDTPADRSGTDAPNDGVQDTDRAGTDAPSDGTQEDGSTADTPHRDSGSDAPTDEPPPERDAPPKDG
jgi:hypothetical protein